MTQGSVTHLVFSVGGCSVISCYSCRRAQHYKRTRYSLRPVTASGTATEMPRGAGGCGPVLAGQGRATKHREDAGGLKMACFTASLVPFSLGWGWRSCMAVFPCPLVHLRGCRWLGAREGGSGDGGRARARCREAMLKVAEADAGQRLYMNLWFYSPIKGS